MDGRAEAVQHRRSPSKRNEAGRSSSEQGQAPRRGMGLYGPGSTGGTRKRPVRERMAKFLREKWRPDVFKERVGERVANVSTRLDDWLAEHFGEFPEDVPIVYVTAHVTRTERYTLSFLSSSTCAEAIEVTLCLSDPFASVPSVSEMLANDEERLIQFTALITAPVVDIDALREQSRRGIPFDARAQVWQLLLGYLPPETAQRDITLHHKRQAYKRLLFNYCDVRLDQPDRTPRRTLPFEDDALTNDIFGEDVECHPDAELLETLPPRLTAEEKQRRSAILRPTASDAVPHTLKKNVLDWERWGDLCDQIHVDVIRTIPEGYKQLFLHPCVLNVRRRQVCISEEQLRIKRESLRVLARVLFVFSVVHHDGNYWQGLNEIPIPFLITFLSFATRKYPHQLNALGEAALQDLLYQSQVEADVYWCVCAFVTELQEHNFAIGKNGSVAPKSMLERMDTVMLLNTPLIHEHLQNLGLDLVYYAFRWMVCLLIREMPTLSIVRLWDAYIADPGNVTKFHPCVCAALVHLYSARLREFSTFEDALMFLQRLPTGDWTERESAHLIDLAFEYFEKMRHVEQEVERVVRSAISAVVVVILVHVIRVSLEMMSEEREREGSDGDKQ